MKNEVVQNNLLNPILRDKKVAMFIIVVSSFMMTIDVFLKIDFLTGAWHIIMYILLLSPLTLLAYTRELKNPYTKWFIPFMFIMIIDMFLYSNQMVKQFLPLIFYILSFMLYLTSMHKVHSLYQIFIPKFELPFGGVSYIKSFIDGLYLKKIDKKLYIRIGNALLITLPFFVVFTLLFLEADSGYKHFTSQLFRFDIDFKIEYITVPLYLFVYLLLFIYSFSNNKHRCKIQETKEFDVLVVSIFLGLINILFISFVVFQILFLFFDDYASYDFNIAEFARSGFFQLMVAMGLVSLIFLFILRRYKGERIISTMLIGLLSLSIIMGIVSLKKMYLYQSLMGATVLRYYVEWFDYFLIVVLALGIIFLVKKYAFTRLLDIITILGFISFTLVVSLNMDILVAKHNIEKFKDEPSKLDKDALSKLSIDALPIIKKHNILVKDKLIYIKNDQKVNVVWYKEYKRRNCNTLARYHYGYCTTIQKYGATYE